MRRDGALFDDGPLRDWLNDHVRTILDRYEDMEGRPFPSLAVVGDAVEADLVQLGVEWLERSGLERENGWDVDAGNEAVAQVLDVAQAVTREATARRWPDRR